MKNNFLPYPMLLGILFLLMTGSFFVNESFAAQSDISIDDQRYIDEVLSKLSFGMTKEEVAQILDQSYTDGIMRISWYPPHTGNKSRAQAYFYKGKLSKITWIKMVGFMKFSVIYEKETSGGANQGRSQK